MKHEPNIAKPVTDMSREELDAWMRSLPPAPGIRHVDDEADDAAALEDRAAGRVYSHALIGQWLQTWGQADSKSFKDWLVERNV